MAYEKKWENWGGARENAGRPRKYGDDVERGPHSLYCDDLEAAFLRYCLERFREYNRHLQKDREDGSLEKMGEKELEELREISITKFFQLSYETKRDKYGY